MTDPHTLVFAENLMLEFARSTGIEPKKGDQKRYLWTDAFAVCNFLTLFKRTGNRKYSDLAILLVDQVHQTLGKFRPDDYRSGWISGLSEREGERHPTIGGLRIGKDLPERPNGQPFDERLEWERDGQYFHYLTKWIHALSRVSHVTMDPRYRRWAIELALTAYAGFTDRSMKGRGKRMYWKMSVDLSRPLVLSMGQHDPLDGWVTGLELLSFPEAQADAYDGRKLSEAIADMAAMCRNVPLFTEDPLGIGGLLFDASRIAQLWMKDEKHRLKINRTLEKVLGSSLDGLKILPGKGTLTLPAESRLAFRELGLSIGLSGMQNISGYLNTQPATSKDPLRDLNREITGRTPIKDMIEQFWMDPRHQKSASWNDHRWINQVMLATSLAPDAFLSI